MQAKILILAIALALVALVCCQNNDILIEPDARLTYYLDQEISNVTAAGKAKFGSAVCLKNNGTLAIVAESKAGILHVYERQQLTPENGVVNETLADWVEITTLSLNYSQLTIEENLPFDIRLACSDGAQFIAASATFNLIQDENDPSMVSTVGTVTIFQLESQGQEKKWNQVALLLNPEMTTSENITEIESSSLPIFGEALTISGDGALIAASGHNRNLSTTGRVHIYVNMDLTSGNQNAQSTWELVTTLTHQENDDIEPFFGRTMNVNKEGNILLISSFSKETVYVYVDEDGTFTNWRLAQNLSEAIPSSNEVFISTFGRDVKIKGGNEFAVVSSTDGIFVFRSDSTSGSFSNFTFVNSFITPELAAVAIDATENANVIVAYNGLVGEDDVVEPHLAEVYIFDEQLSNWKIEATLFTPAINATGGSVAVDYTPNNPNGETLESTFLVGAPSSNQEKGLAIFFRSVCASDSCNSVSITSQ